MADFQFLQNPVSKKWVVSAPNRAKRPGAPGGPECPCPFCPGQERDRPDVFRIDGRDGEPAWRVRVIANEYPFAPIHEVIIHSPDHHKNFPDLPLHQVELILQAYRNRFREHKDDGQIIIYSNHGEMGGESIPHPHSQVVAVPKEISLDMPSPEEIDAAGIDGKALETEFFALFCPKTSEWPDEVWIAPKKRGRYFSDTTDEELKDLAHILHRLPGIMTEVYGHEFPFNLYIYPGRDWYLRFMPRSKSLAGFELSTGIVVNTKDPQETVKFIRERFPDSK
jgi:UDPglucose--hexose-1-phosphate uridylyltransferase